MKFSLGLLVLLALPALAQRHPRPHECRIPGQVLGTEYLGETSDTVSAEHRRDGAMDIPADAAFTGALRTKIYKNYRDRICRTEAYQYTERECRPVSPDLALGRGNQLLASLYDLHNTTLRRAEIFAGNVRYQSSYTASDRLETGRIIVEALTKDAMIKGIPKAWDDFAAVLQKAVVEGVLTQYIADDILSLNKDINMKVLGFLPLPDARVTEGPGNGRLAQVFDLGLSPEQRTMRIQKMLSGITMSTARALSTSFITFASTYGIPSNWAQFVLMMKASRDAGAVSELEFRQVTVDHEDTNRLAMGYEIKAEVCTMVTRTEHVNVVRAADRRNIDREMSQPYQIAVSGAPLLAGEREVFTVRYDGFREPVLSSGSSFNAYRITQAIEGRFVKFKAVGSRVKIRPSNSLKVKLDRRGSISILQIQNPAFNPKASERVVVKVEFYNGRLFRDRLLGTETYELTDGSLKTITAALRNKEVDYVKVSMQIPGSSFYNAEFSNEIKIKD